MNFGIKLLNLCFLLIIIMKIFLNIRYPTILNMKLALKIKLSYTLCCAYLYILCMYVYSICVLLRVCILAMLSLMCLAVPKQFLLLFKVQWDKKRKCVMVFLKASWSLSLCLFERCLCLPFYFVVMAQPLHAALRWHYSAPSPLRAERAIKDPRFCHKVSHMMVGLRGWGWFGMHCQEVWRGKLRVIIRVRNIKGEYYSSTSLSRVFARCRKGVGVRYKSHNSEKVAQ